jgi:hypothetical protein
MIRKLARPRTAAWTGFMGRSGFWMICGSWHNSDYDSVCWTRSGSCYWSWRTRSWRIK